MQAGINKITKLKNGAVLIDLNEKDAPERLKTLLSENYETKLTNLNKPRVIITGLSQKYDNNRELMDELISLNNVSINEEDKIDIKYTRQTNYSKKWVLYVEISTKTFHKLANKYVNIGWGTHFVKEDLNIGMCYNCIGYEHKSTMCDRTKVYSRCARPHDVKECKSDIMQCTNCRYAREKYNTTYNVNHTGCSTECPIHQKKITEMKQKLTILTNMKPTPKEKHIIQFIQYNI